MLTRLPRGSIFVGEPKDNNADKTIQGQVLLEVNQKTIMLTRQSKCKYVVSESKDNYADKTIQVQVLL